VTHLKHVGADVRGRVQQWGRARGCSSMCVSFYGSLVGSVPGEAAEVLRAITHTNAHTHTHTHTLLCGRWMLLRCCWCSDNGWWWERGGSLSVFELGEARCASGGRCGCGSTRSYLLRLIDLPNLELRLFVSINVTFYSILQTEFNVSMINVCFFEIFFVCSGRRKETMTPLKG
jgi:hypothetical protein